MRLTLPALSALLVLAGAGCRPTPSNKDSASAPPLDTAAGRAAPAPQPADTNTVSTAVELRTDKTHYRAGDAVTMTFVNQTATDTFAFNPCPRVIQRQVEIGWVPVDEPARMCTMEAWILKPHETRTAQTKLPTPLPPGPVRIVVDLSKQGTSSGGRAEHAVSPVLTIDA
jgi:hypothetical protein